MVTHDGNMLGMDVCRGKDMHILESLRSILVMEFILSKIWCSFRQYPHTILVVYFFFSHFYVTNISRYTRKG